MKLHLKKILLASASVLITIVLTACGGGGSDDENGSTSSSTTLNGSGVKGPLANALVSVYEADTTNTNFQANNLLAFGRTDESAQITGLSIPVSATPPFILEFEAIAGTVDITTGNSPVISRMRTVVTQTMIDENAPVYATPLTTIAVKLAIANADKNNSIYSGNGDGNTSVSEFTEALPIAAAQVESSLGFGLTNTVDIFTTPPLVTTTTDDLAKQTDVASYRTAVETLTAILMRLKENSFFSSVTTDDLLVALADDLSDGEIDGRVNGEIINDLRTTNDNLADIIRTDPSTLTIPGTDTLVADIETILASEIIITGVTTIDVTALENGSISVTPTAAKIVSDLDGDGIEDNIDNCPLVSIPSQLDTDNDGQGNLCDIDDDGDGVIDEKDDFPLDSTETTDTDNDTIGNNADTDDDNDGVLDTDDDFPLDNTETTDTDGDGTGNNADTDDDGDGVADSEDNCPLDDNNNQADTDGDGIGDACDDETGAVWNQTHWNETNWQ